MLTPRLPVRGFASDGLGRMAATPRTSDIHPHDASTMRIYEAVYLTETGGIGEISRIAPAAPIVEEAFATMARGTLIATEAGVTAVEDLLPGDIVRTAHGGNHPVLWIGSMTLLPEAVEGSGSETLRMTRVAADSFGIGRPAPDLVLGPRARVLHRSARCREMLGTSRAFAPARGFIDGVSVIEVTPVAPVRLYQIALHGQQAILANGIEVETYHPGPQIETILDGPTRAVFLELFPHLADFDRFGPMDTPRLTAFELEALRGI